MTATNAQLERLPTDLRNAVDGLIRQWQATGGTRRLWQGDESLWTSSGESDWLGWLSIAQQQAADTSELHRFAEHVRGRYSHAVLLGMGGSSLCPEVLRLCFGPVAEFPDLRILDSTDPQQIRDCEQAVELESTLFLSASKSGSTLETSLLTQYFLERLKRRVAAEDAVAHFVAITDPGSALEASARHQGFGHVFYGLPSIGGRYSALSHFGMVPAAAMGLDVDLLLGSAGTMQAACGPAVPAAKNPGLRLGLILGASALAGRDKLTLVCSPGVASLGAWIEQLVAESTGKLGKGIVPVDGERLGAPADYTSDRIFAYLILDSEPDKATDAALDLLRYAGHPVVQIEICDLAGLGQEFLRWEFATAVAGAVLGINPFDQPDVESSKVATRKVTAAYEAAGSLPEGDALLENDWTRVFASPAYARVLVGQGQPDSVVAVLATLIGSLRPNEYFAFLAYLNRSRKVEAAIGRLRGRFLQHAQMTTVGFGPRFLHSTGQLHKGGPNSGVFLQIGCDAGPEIPVPGRDIGFGVVKAAQALGDFDVLSSAGRRALRLQLKGDLTAALERLEMAFAEALQ